MITPAIDRMDDRMDAIFSAIKNDTVSLSGYVKKRSRLMHPSQQKPNDLKKGVLMLVSNGESQYSKSQGLIAKKGLHEFLLIGHLKVDSDKPSDVEKDELDMAENIKTFVRSGVPGMTLFLDSIQNSWQQEAPHGWLVVRLTAAPPGHSLT